MKWNYFGQNDFKIIYADEQRNEGIVTVNKTDATNAMRGENYHALSDVDRQRLVDAFVEGRDYKAVARALGKARQTVRNIIEGKMWRFV